MAELLVLPWTGNKVFFNIWSSCQCGSLRSCTSGPHCSPPHTIYYVQMHCPEAALHHHLAPARKENKTTPDHHSQDFLFTTKTSKFKRRGKGHYHTHPFSQGEKVNICKAFRPQEFRDTSHQLFKKQLISSRAKEEEAQVAWPGYKHCLLPSFPCQ